MNYRECKDKTFKLSLKVIILLITALLILSSIWMIIYAMRARMYNEKSIHLSKMHMKYTDIASELNLGSNNLTEYVRLFAETGDTVNMQNYFAEANDT